MFFVFKNGKTNLTDKLIIYYDQKKQQAFPESRLWLPLYMEGKLLFKQFKYIITETQNTLKNVIHR